MLRLWPREEILVASLLVEDPGVTYGKAQKWLRGRLTELPDYLERV